MPGMVKLLRRNAMPTIMAIGAHHDDNELIAGTLARHKAAGWEIVSVVVTNGVYIRGEVSDKHIEIREKESLAAAELLGMKCSFLRFPEGDFRNGAEPLLVLTEQIRRFSPGIVITHPPRDYHFDHMQVSQCVVDAVLVCGNPCVRSETPACSSNPRLYYCDAWFIPFEPDVYVDVTEHMELKTRMLGCHKSQLLPATDGAGNMIDLARLQNRNRGIEAGVGYAEAFRLRSSLGSVRIDPLL